MVEFRDVSADEQSALADTNAPSSPAMPEPINTSEVAQEIPKVTAAELDDHITGLNPQDGSQEADAVSFRTIDAPNNIVYDKPNNRMVSLPQTLNADETKFVMHRDIDQVKNFYGMQPVNPWTIAKNAAQGVAAVVAKTPGAVGGLVLSQAEQAQQDQYREAEVDNAIANQEQGDEGDAANAALISGETGAKNLENRLINGIGAQNAIDWSKKLIDSNQKMLDEHGLERPKDGVGGAVYDIFYNGGQLGSTLAASFFMKNPEPAYLYFAALQKSDAYQEARAAGEDPETAGDTSNIRTAIGYVANKVGIETMKETLAGNSAVQRFIAGAAIHAGFGAAQAGADKAVTQTYGITEQSGADITKDIMYQAFINTVVGGTTDAVAGHFVKTKATEAGIPEPQAEKLAKYTQDNISEARQNMGEFIDKELSPIAANDEGVSKFMQIMKEFSNDKDLVKRNDLSPKDREIFDHYVEMFNHSTRDDTGIAGVEKKFVEQAKKAGVSDEEAQASGKLVAARADAASRALGITPAEWYASKNLEVQRYVDQHVFKKSVNDNLDEFINKARKSANGEKFSLDTGSKEAKTPILNYLREKGGVKVGSPLDQELRNMGINPKEAIGLFKRDGKMTDLDTIEPQEIRSRLGDNSDFKTDADYVDQNKLLDAIRDENFNKGKSKTSVDEEYLQHIIEELDQRGIDPRDMTNEQIKDILKADPEEAPFYQSAFHGTPYHFDKFTLDHLGSGEGAQAFGWGLYFAGNKEIGEYYRKQLAEEKANFFIKGKEITNPTEKYIAKIMLEKGKDVATQRLQNNLEAEEISKWPVGIADAKAMIKKFANISERDIKKGSGQLYEVTLPESHELLDYDKPLSKQEPQVEAALKKIGIEVDREGLNKFDDALLDALTKDGDPNLPKQPSDPTGEEIYKSLSRKLGSDKAASEYLNENGIKGIQFLDGNSRTKENGHHNFVIFDDKAIDIVNRFYQVESKEPRGQIEFGKDKTVITLFEKANASTLVHELGHLFLRDMQDVSGASIRPMVKADYEAVKQWLGAKGETFTRAQEEKFARGFERYLMEGKAPVPELQSTFEKFKNWLTTIYKHVKNLNVHIDDRVRNVFDRMLGGDYAQSEKLMQAEGERNTTADYDTISKGEIQTPKTGGVGSVLRDLGDFGGDIFAPISTRLGNIHESLKHAVRKYYFDTGLHRHEDRIAVKPFIEGAVKMTPEDQRVLDFAMKNRDMDKVNSVVEKYGLQDQLKTLRDTFDVLHNDAKAVGIDLGYIADYFPRQVHPELVGDYLAEMRKMKEWTEIQLALKDADPQGKFNDEEKADFINTYLRGYDSNKTNVKKSSFTKERSVDYITPEMNKYYKNSLEVIAKYIDGVRYGIETRKLIGSKTEEQTKYFSRSKKIIDELNKTKRSAANDVKAERISAREAFIKQLKVRSLVNGEDIGDQLSNIEKSLEKLKNSEPSEVKLKRINKLQKNLEKVQSEIGNLNTDNLDDSIGSYVNKLLDQGMIKEKDVQKLKEILKAVVNPQGEYGFVAWAKNASYVYTMGSPINAISQIQDLAFSLYKNGIFRTGKGIAKALTGTQEFTKQDLGLENILQSFGDEDNTSAIVRKTLKATGLDFLDGLTKDIYINGSYDRLVKAAKTNNSGFKDELSTIFGDGGDQVMKDLKEGNVTNDVKYLLFSELSDIQPISHAEMPLNYLRGGNGRIFYTLKSFTIKQIDLFRRDVFSTISKGIDAGDAKMVGQGMGNLIKLSASLMVMGMASDDIKDLILGRPIDFEDQIMNNIVALFGATKYQIYKSKQDGLLHTLFETLFVPPVGGILDDVYKDAAGYASGTKQPKDFQTLGHLPFLGKFYYWWFGGGRTKIQQGKG